MNVKHQEFASLIRLVASLIALLAIPAIAGDLQSVTAKAAPALNLPTLSGKPFSMSSQKGKVLLVNFWASWCPPCRAELPSIWRLKHKLDLQLFEVLLVNVGEDKAQVEAFLVPRLQRDLLVLLDETGISSGPWAVQAMPMSYIVDKNGIIRYQLQGATRWDSTAVMSQIRSLIDETPSPSQSRARK